MELSLIYKWANLVIFLGATIYFLREPLRNFLGDRRVNIKKELDEVARERLRIEQRFQEYRKKLAEAQKEISELMKDLKKEGELEKLNLVRKAQTFAAKIREDAERIGVQELGKAKFLLRRATLLHAVELAKEGLKKTVDAFDHEKLVAWGIKHLEELSL